MFPPLSSEACALSLVEIEKLCRSDDVLPPPSSACRCNHLAEIMKAPALPAGAGSLDEEDSLTEAGRLFPVHPRCRPPSLNRAPRHELSLHCRLTKTPLLMRLLVIGEAYDPRSLLSRSRRIPFL